MKKIITIGLLLAFTSISSFAQVPEGLGADWIFVSENNNSSNYLNLKSIKKDGSLRTIWQARVDKKENNSSKTMLEFNCKTDQFRILSGLYYKNTNFSEINKSDNIASNWIHIPPDSYVGDLRDILCKTN
jgi:hypothetical protein